MKDSWIKIFAIRVKSWATVKSAKDAKKNADPLHVGDRLMIKASPTAWDMVVYVDVCVWRLAVEA